MKNDDSLERYLERFSFDLPPERIAREPAERRDGSRLLLVDRRRETFTDHAFHELPDLLKPRDLLIRNATRVSHRRVYLRRPSGGRHECLFLEPAETPGGDPFDSAGTHPGATYICLVKNARKIKDGEDLHGADESLRFRFTRTPPDDGPAGACRLTAIDATGAPAWTSARQAEEFFARHGEVPLPPYFKRAPTAADRERYQTVYADNPGSVAAPTAGLHFTPELEERLRARHVEMARLELLISYGTFAPLGPEHFERGRLHPETYTIPDDFPGTFFAPDPNNTPRNGSAARKIAVGTTSLRALEDNIRRFGEIRPGTYRTDLFLKPAGHQTGNAATGDPNHSGDRVHSVDGLLTNFHLPASSLLLLVAVFAGSDLTMAAYRHALAGDYRFYSYGDAMLIL